ncbi:YybS family protein [Gottfriedia luciferensis]|uniref:YybS family protein n=1 Tax=Gottfriedia luciferensis TaxID=178774 RepID=UPI000B44EAB3|nr:YybS family protein [Gottfriedia luciferensis]
MKSTRFITEGAVLLAIYSVLLLMITYVPFLSLILTFLMPLPFIVFSLKYSIKESLLLCCVAIGITMVITSATVIPSTLMFSTIGIALGYLIKNERSKGEILITSTFLYLIHIVLIYLLAKTLFNMDIVKDMMNSMTDAIEKSKEMYSSLGVKPNQNGLDDLLAVIKLIPTLFPTLLLMFSFTLAFLTQLVTFPLIKRFGYKTPKFKPFREFRLPAGFMWFFLIVMIISFFKLKQGSFFNVAVINVTYVLQVLVIVQGYASIFYFSYLKQFSKAVPIIIMIASLIIQPLIYIVLLIGIVSIGIFNRRIN